VRGPLVLARDKRLGGDIYKGVQIATDAHGYVQLTPVSKPSAIGAWAQHEVPTRTGGGVSRL